MRQEVIDAIVEALYSYRVGASTLADLQNSVSRYGLIIEDHSEATAILSELEEEESEGKAKKPSKLKKFLKVGAAVAGAAGAAALVHHMRKGKKEAPPMRTLTGKKGSVEKAVMRLKVGAAQRKAEIASAPKHEPKSAKKKFAPAVSPTKRYLASHPDLQKKGGELRKKPREYLASISKKKEPEKKPEPAATSKAFSGAGSAHRGEHGKTGPSVRATEKPKGTTKHTTTRRDVEHEPHEVGSATTDSLSVHDERLLNLLETYLNGYLTFDSLRESLLPLGIVLHNQAEALYLAKSFLAETVEADQEEEEETPDEEEKKKG